MGVTFFESVTAAASVGMGCGTCCGTGISAALYGYLATHVKNVGQSFRAFLDFFLGKVLAVIALCCTASLVGGKIIDDSGLLFGVRIGIIVDSVMLVMGMLMLVGWIRERRGHKSCKSCKHCAGKQKPSENEKSPSHTALISMGIGYGISPCAPLILMTGYAATLPLGYAAALGAVFAVASTISPVLFMLLISGVLAKKMRSEIPQYLSWFRLACYVLLIIMFAVSLIKEVMAL